MVLLTLCIMWDIKSRRTIEVTDSSSRMSRATSNDAIGYGGDNDNDNASDTDNINNKISNNNNNGIKYARHKGIETIL